MSRAAAVSASKSVFTAADDFTCGIEALDQVSAVVERSGCIVDIDTTIGINRP